MGGIVGGLMGGMSGGMVGGMRMVMVGGIEVGMGRVGLRKMGGLKSGVCRVVWGMVGWMIWFGGRGDRIGI